VGAKKGLVELNYNVAISILLISKPKRQLAAWKISTQPEKIHI
jgi:hypothetical protein